MLLLLSYCSVFKVQNCYAILPTKLRFVCANSAAHKNFRPFIAYAKFYFIKFCKHGRLLLLVGLRGLEPPTSRLSGVRSNHLSYKPMLVSGDGRRFFVFRRPVVEMRRIELLTPCLQGRCSPSWATPPNLVDTSLLTNIKSLVIFRMSRMSNLRLASYSPMCLLVTATSLPIAPLRFTISHRHAHTMFRIATQC